MELPLCACIKLIKCLKYLRKENIGRKCQLFSKIRSCSYSKCFFPKFLGLQLIALPRSCATFISNKRQSTHLPVMHTSVPLDTVFMMCTKHETVLRSSVSGCVWKYIAMAERCCPFCYMFPCMQVRSWGGGQPQISVPSTLFGEQSLVGLKTAGGLGWLAGLLCPSRAGITGRWYHAQHLCIIGSRTRPRS